VINQINFPPALRRQVRDLIAIGGRITRDGVTVVVDGPAEVAGALRTETDQLATYIVPSVTPDDAALVRNLLTDAGASVAYVTDPAAAREAVADIRASQPEVIGLDVETEVLPAFRQPIPVAFNKDGKLAARQPRDGAAGAALDPYRSRVRLVQAWAGGQHCLVFDMRTVAWADVAPLFDLPLAIFNAVFEVKRLIHEAGIVPSGRIFDVMTATASARRSPRPPCSTTRFPFLKFSARRIGRLTCLRPNSWNTPRWTPFSAVSCGSLSKPNCSTTLTSNARS
jgi:CheY-like chemotaxis protein